MHGVTMTLSAWGHHGCVCVCPWLCAHEFIMTLCTRVHDFMHVCLSRLLCVCVHGFVHVGLSQLYVRVSTALCTCIYHNFYVRVSTALYTWVYHDLMYACPWLYARRFITSFVCVYPRFYCTWVYYDFMEIIRHNALWHEFEICLDREVVEFSLQPIMHLSWFVLEIEGRCVWWWLKDANLKLNLSPSPKVVNNWRTKRLCILYLLHKSDHLEHGSIHESLPS